MTLDIITAHAGSDSLKEAMNSWDYYPVICNGNNGILSAYQDGYENSMSEILAYLHDDLIINDPKWIAKVLALFREDEKIGLIGFGGAKIHGSPDLYKTTYNYKNLGRGKYVSNTIDAEIHGERIEDNTKVAVLDGFALIVRRSILDRSNGWPVSSLDYIGYDYWLSCITRRFGYKIVVVPISCIHLGGRTAVALKKNLDTSGEIYQKSHRYIYEEFFDVLPFEVR